MREANSVLFTTVSTSTGLTIMPRISQMLHNFHCSGGWVSEWMDGQMDDRTEVLSGVILTLLTQTEGWYNCKKLKLLQISIRGNNIMVGKESYLSTRKKQSQVANGTASKRKGQQKGFLGWPVCSALQRGVWVGATDSWGPAPLLQAEFRLQPPSPWVPFFTYTSVSPSFSSTIFLGFPDLPLTLQVSGQQGPTKTLLQPSPQSPAQCWIHSMKGSL